MSANTPMHTSVPDSSVAASAQSQTIIRTELRVIGCLALLLLAIEHGTWRFQDRLSYDVEHLQELPQLARDLASNADENELRLLFLGNSMTRYGVDGEAFAQTLQRRSGLKTQWTKVNPDNTAIPDWYYAYIDFFQRPQLLPDVVILGFEGRHLQDQPSHHPGRLAHYYCQQPDWSDLEQYDLFGFESQADFILSRVSTAWTNRDRVERRILDTFIPSYRESIQVVNESVSTPLELAQQAHPTYHRVDKLLQTAQEDHVQFIMVAMPLGNEYELDPALLDIFERYNVPLVDCRHIPNMTPEMFPDGVHMTADASKIYSTYLAEHLTRQQLTASR